MLTVKKIGLLASFVVLALTSFAQTKPLTGFVLDSLNRPIAYANVVAINQNTQRISMHLKDLKAKTPAELVSMAEELGVEGASTMRRQDLMFCILR